MSVLKTIFWEAVRNGDVQTAMECLAKDNSLAGNNFDPEHAAGYPLYHSTRQFRLDLTEALLIAGADVNATPPVENPAMRGMPLMNAFHESNRHGAGNYDLVYLLLSYGPNLNAHGDCTTPFVDCLFNNVWETGIVYEPGKVGPYKLGAQDEVSKLFRNSYASYLQADETTARPAGHGARWCKCLNETCAKMVSVTSEVEASGKCECGDNLYLNESAVQRQKIAKLAGAVVARTGERCRELELLRDVVTMGGQPSLFTLVRHEQHELIAELLSKCPTKPGTAMDWPEGTVFSCIMNGATWCGYPKTVAACQQHCPNLYTTEVAKYAIERAIASHNRDGGIDQYFEIVQSQLRYLKDHGKVCNFYDSGRPFLPLHWLASKFIESSHYGFKCERLGTEDDILRMGKLFIDFGFDANSVDPKTGLSAVAIAEQEGHGAYAEFLIRGF